MIFNVTISTLPDYTLFSFTGEVDVHKISALASYLYSDYHYSQNPCSVWDLSNAVLKVNPHEAVNLAHTILSKRLPGMVGLTAFITPEYEQYRQALEIFSVTVEGKGIMVEAFPNLKKAAFWFDKQKKLLKDSILIPVQLVEEQEMLLLKK